MPDYPLAVSDLNVIYSIKYGIISLGHMRRRRGLEMIFNLQFDHLVQENNWKWTDNRWKKILSKRFGFCNVLMETETSSKLFLIGGGSAAESRSRECLTTVEMLDLAKNEWMGLKGTSVPRVGSGTCLDEQMERIYVAGGATTPQLVEWYDMRTNQWFADIPSPSYKYRFNATIFKDCNMLYMVGSTNALEFIDLRMKCDKWQQKQFMQDI
eukprot:1160065_1